MIPTTHVLMSLTFLHDMVLAPNMDVLASSPTNVACPYCEGVSNRYSPGIRVFDITTRVKKPITGRFFPG